MKNVWKVTMIVLLGVSLMLAGFTSWRSTPSVALAQDNPQSNRITVTGEGVLKLKADTALITLGVITDASTAEEAQGNNADKMTVVQSALGRILTPSDEWETTNLSLSPQYDWSEQGKGKLTGFRAENTILITLSDPSRAGEVIDSCVKSGANNVNDIQFTLRDPQKTRIEAIKLAMQNAQEKASAALSVAGKSIKDTVEVNVSDSSYNQPVPMIYNAYDSAKSQAAAPTPTPVQAGSLEVRATVNVVYSF